MNILIIPFEHFITESQPLAGIFQQHQAKALLKVGNKIGMIVINEISVRDVWKQKEVLIEYLNMHEMKFDSYPYSREYGSKQLVGLIHDE